VDGCVSYIRLRRAVRVCAGQLCITLRLVDRINLRSCEKFCCWCCEVKNLKKNFCIATRDHFDELFSRNFEKQSTNLNLGSFLKIKMKKLLVSKA
jgi:hypothetical protein